nr:DUF3226 domain-containing protein [Myxococcus sp. CA033]
MHARSVGVLLDVEDDPASAYDLARRTMVALGGGLDVPVHGTFEGQPRKLGVFLTPDGHQPGSIEKLCKQAVRNQELARCVDALVTCAGAPQSTQALKDKGWLNAYLAMLSSPLRFYQVLQHPQGIDPAHTAFDSLRAFLQSL